MPRGGARTRSGPPPDPNALRRERPADKAGWTVLPAGGRSAPAPEWPLTDPSPREMVLWSQLWSRPQAVAWQALDQALEVALFVRLLVEVEEPDASSERRKQLRSYMDSLGLSVAGMLRNRWRVAPVAEEPGEELAPGGGERPARRSARDRMKVIEGGA
ncbi:hypothetical protein RM844_28755 [Streptomyces sp. DSM 44915]|uniref:Terminase small subunit n=1 Tax=Streptomyces chisholmiae TaxID=3075540 RepID=A0ABU2JZS5_9ACTN|nr:hypothetical protein [Streptomyces sp. DSM 44915]MDT0270268.1 hypothetical protein [Streptomyces sp. DSM 44915]